MTGSKDVGATSALSYSSCVGIAVGVAVGVCIGIGIGAGLAACIGLGAAVGIGVFFGIYQPVAAYTNDWHTYGVEWSAQSISFLLDGKVYFT